MPNVDLKRCRAKIKSNSTGGMIMATWKSDLNQPVEEFPEST